MRNILYIINPISGTKSKIGLQAFIEEETTKKGFQYKICPSVANGDYSFLDEEIKEGSFTHIVAAGGDGTVNAVIQSLKKHGLPFGILPCGSGNGLAFSAGISKNRATALRTVFKGKAKWADAFTVNEHFACMLCGLGFDAQVAHDFASDKKRGLSTYIKKIIHNFFAAQTYRFNLTFGDTELAIDAYFISVANSNQFGNNFMIAPQASLTDGLLDVVILTQQNKLNVLLHTIMQVSGFNRLQQVEILNENTSVIYFQTASIVINNEQGAPLHIDGEPAHNTHKIEVNIMPKSFQLIFP